MARDYDTMTFSISGISISGGGSGITYWIGSSSAVSSYMTISHYDDYDEPQIIEREVVRYVDRPVYIEKEVLVEKKIYVNQTVIKDNVFNNSPLTINADGTRNSGWSSGTSFFTVKSGSTIQEVKQPNIQEVRQMDYTSVGFIVATLIVCIAYDKIIRPHITLKNIMKAVVRLVVWPFKKAYQAASSEWKEVNKEKKEE